MKLTKEQKAKLPTKRFDGVIYYPEQVFIEKKDAKHFADGARRLGWKARVMPCRRTGKLKWLVYARPKGQWTPFTPQG